jgi:DNA-binding beta-propeller fold protein YncE
MKRTDTLWLAGLAALGILGATSLTPAARAADYKFFKEIQVGGDGGWDYLTVDEAGRRLYVSHGAKVVVIDIDKDAVAGEIADTPGVHGFAVARDLGRGFSSKRREGKSSGVDLKTLATISKIGAGENPDAIIHEPGQKEVCTFNGRGNSSTVIDAASGKVVATIPMPGKPEFAAADPNRGGCIATLRTKARSW